MRVGAPPTGLAGYGTFLRLPLPKLTSWRRSPHSSLRRSAAGLQHQVDLNPPSFAKSRHSSGFATRVSPTYSQMSRLERSYVPPSMRRAFGTQRSTGWRSAGLRSQRDCSAEMCRHHMRVMRSYKRYYLGSTVLEARRRASLSSSSILMRVFRSGDIATSRWWSEPLAESRARVALPVWNISQQACAVRSSQTFGPFATE